MEERVAHKHRSHRAETESCAPAHARGPANADSAAEQAQTARRPNTSQDAVAVPHDGSDRGEPEAGSPAERIADLEADLATAKAEAAENWEKFLRERAEMENYKRRIERTFAELAKQGRKDLLLKVLTALDNLDRALHYESTSGGGVDPRTLLMGLRMTHQQFKELLGAEGLKEIETVGQKFDPARHEAVATETAPDKEEGAIVAELQKGYTYQDELLRPAKVKVATKE